MLRAEDLAGPESVDWYALTPQQRFQESEKLWSSYLALGGSLDPEPDTLRRERARRALSAAQ